MLNPFFQQGSRSEQGLIQDLINEQLKMYGVEVYYMPRKYLTEKKVIKEVIESKFDNAYPIEAYVNNYEGYSNDPVILSKFGIQALNEITLTISRERFETYIKPLTKNLPNIKLADRPKEGDLIYFPLGDRIFEIKYVEHEKPFYQLQGNYTYELRCELFQYDGSEIDTGVDDIDDTGIDVGYIQKFTLVGVGSTATAITGIVNGGVSRIIVTNRGSGYTSAPRVAISSAPSGGKTAVGIASLIYDIIDCNGTSSGKVQEVQIINPGYGYSVAPSVLFVGGGGSGAAATSIIGDGTVGIITITSGGSGYSTVPTVTFSSPGIGTTATGTALLNSSGIVTSIAITNAGVGYTEVPTITISSPFTQTIGNFEFNETITGQTSGSTARVNSWDSVTGVLEIYVVSGSFIVGETIVGSATSAVNSIRQIDYTNVNDSYADNENIEELADEILDFSESNPFGLP